MKKIFLITAFSLLFFGCNINPNKEARIQKLETELEQTIATLNKLEKNVQVLKDLNDELEIRIVEIEKRND